MQLHFAIRGSTHCVEHILKYLEQRMILIPNWENEEDYNAGKEPKELIPSTYILRNSIGGTYELVIPEQEADKWMTSLDFHKPLHPNTLKMKAGIKFLRLAMGLKKIPKFKTDEQIIFPAEYRKWCEFIPIGVKYDEYKQFADGFHEAL